MKWHGCLYSLILILAGCTQTSVEDCATVSPTAGASQFALANEPEGAIGVLDLREQAKDGDTVAVVGCVGGGVNPWVKGRAAFVLVDASSASMECDDACCEEGCNCKAAELTDSIAVVKFLDTSGQVIACDARELLGLQLRDTVVVHGKASRDKAGNVALIADGLYIRR